LKPFALQEKKLIQTRRQAPKQANPFLYSGAPTACA